MYREPPLGVRPPPDRYVYVLAGEGEHEGTSVALREEDVAAITWRARELAQQRADYVPQVHSLLVGESKPSPQEAEILAAELDRRFMLAHHDRLVREQQGKFAAYIIECFAKAFA